MDQNPTGGNTEAAPASQVSDTTPSNTEALAGRSVEDLVKGLADKRESKKNSGDRKRTDAKQELAESGETPSEPVEAGTDKDQEAPPEQKISPRESRRIKALVNQRNELRDQLKELRLKLQETEAGNKIYHEELVRISKLARLDPATEDQRRQELSARSQQLEQEIAQSVESEYSSLTEMQQAQLDAHELYEEMSEAAESWDGIFSPIELGHYMRQHNNFDVKAAARELGLAREAKIAAKLKRTQAQAPMTASAGSSGTAQSAAGSKVPSSAEDIEKWIKQKTGR